MGVWRMKWETQGNKRDKGRGIAQDTAPTRSAASGGALGELGGEDVLGGGKHARHGRLQERFQGFLEERQLQQ